jgi:uncharacterized protein YwlG (UPF0340 family)
MEVSFRSVPVMVPEDTLQMWKLMLDDFIEQAAKYIFLKLTQQFIHGIPSCSNILSNYIASKASQKRTLIIINKIKQKQNKKDYRIY